jgi:hypothetical protein
MVLMFLMTNILLISNKNIQYLKILTLITKNGKLGSYVFYFKNNICVTVKNVNFKIHQFL